jgi:hypothetical protein
MNRQFFAARRHDRAAVVTEAEHRAALEAFLRDEFLDERNRALADCREFSFERGDGNA